MKRLLTVVHSAQYADYILVPVLLAILLLQVWSSADRINLLGDEGTHLASGYSYWSSRDFRLNREHPPLVKLVGALPLVLKGLSTEQSWPIFLSAPAWDTTTNHQWDFAESLLLYENGGQLPENLKAARRAESIFVLTLACCIYWLSRRLFGTLGGIISLLAAVFNPDVLAHAGLITTDMAMATFYFAAPVSLWWYLQRPAAVKLATVGLMLGLGLASKYSNLLLLPVLTIMVAVAWKVRLACHELPSTWFNPFGRGAAALHLRQACSASGFLVATAALVLWSAYLFTEPFVQYWQSYQLLYSNLTADFQYFMLGDYAPRFWNYFLVTTSLKTPLPLFGLLALALVAFWLFWRHTLSALTKLVLFLPPVLLFVVMSLKAQNMGHRYVLGIYPYAFVVLGMTSYWFRQGGKAAKSVMALLVIACLAANTYAGVRAYPFYLSYHNALVSSSLDFIEDLDDSNNDWGQGWLELARIQKEERLSPLFVYPYGGTEYYLGGAPGNWELVNQFSSDPPAPGFHAISSTLYVRNRDALRQRGIHIPLLHDYTPQRIVAGCIVLVQVPLLSPVMGN